MSFVVTMTIAVLLGQCIAVCQPSTLLYYVSGRPNEHGIWVSREMPDGKYQRGTKVLLDGKFDGNAVDPDLVMLPDGRLRMYYFKGYFVSQPPPNAGPSPIFSAVSTDGVNFTIEQQVFAYDNIFDPSVIALGGNEYLMACTQMGNMSVNTVLARSSDGGATFTYEATLQNTGVPELHRFDDGTVRLYYGGPDGIMSKTSQDRGKTWTQEPGSRCKGQGFIGDPGVYRSDDQSWWLFVKGFNGTNNQRPSGHKIQRARSTDRGMSFAITDQLVLDSASVPEGIAFTSRCEIAQQATPQTVCAGENATFSLTMDTAGIGAVSYRWYRGTTRLSDDARYRGCTTSTLSMSNIGASDAGEYTCHISMLVATIPIRSLISTATACTLREMPSITTNLDDTTRVNVGATVTLRVAGRGAAPQWQWYRNGTPLPAATADQLVIDNVQLSNDGDSYAVELRDACDTLRSMATTLRVIDPTSVDEMALLSHIRVTPCPAADVVMIDLDGSADRLTHIDVIDNTGQRCATFDVRGARELGSSVLHISVAQLPNGVYHCIGRGLQGHVAAARIQVIH